MTKRPPRCTSNVISWGDIPDKALPAMVLYLCVGFLKNARVADDVQSGITNFEDGGPVCSCGVRRDAVDRLKLCCGPRPLKYDGAQCSRAKYEKGRRTEAG